MSNRNTNIKLITEPAFLPILCYALPYFFVLIFNKLETILKINEKYFEKSLQLSK